MDLTSKSSQNPWDVTKEIFAYHRPLLEVILGEYSFDDSIRIYINNELSRDESHYVMLHELSHRRAVNSTTFGTVQLILGKMLRGFEYQDQGSLNWINDIHKLLEETISASWYAHEGYAEYCAEKMSEGKYLQTLVKNRQAHYETAVNYMKKIERSIPTTLSFVSLLIVDSFFKIIMNTSILENCPLLEIDTKLIDHLSIKSNRPDYRLIRISADIGTKFFTLGIVSRLLDELEETLRIYGFDFDTYFQWVSSDLENSTLMDQMSINYEVNEIITKHIELAFRNSFPDFEYLNINESRKASETFYRSASEYLKQYKIELRPRTIAKDLDPWEVFLMTDVDEPIVKNMFTEILHPVDHWGDDYAKLMKSENVFLAEFGELVVEESDLVVEEGHYYNISLLPLTLVDRDRSDDKKIKTGEGLIHAKPTFEKYTFWGGLDFINLLWLGFQDNTLWTFLEMSAVDQTTWTIKPPIAELIGDSTLSMIAIPFSRAPLVIPILKCIKSIGVKAIYPIPYPKQIHYETFLLLPNSNLPTVVKIKGNLIYYLQAREAEFTQWFEENIVRKPNFADDTAVLGISEWLAATELAILEGHGAVRNAFNPPEIRFT